MAIPTPCNLASRSIQQSRAGRPRRDIWYRPHPCTRSITSASQESAGLASQQQGDPREQPAALQGLRDSASRQAAASLAPGHVPLRPPDPLWNTPQ
ncbi:hypothetical protein NDU88_001529 [Pleurodeles waltl]|uniref:Uncharacterized protein n=1 Tax=Pleurodeles waltl TaxID=8319 RepID=A0AAV7KT53_PLEWA|nr:hypothetical protein NDU88_001529 [Pleurodeles waltl]